MATISTQNQRIVSIDIFRALTMFFMVFVNDLWSLTSVPHWLEHAAYDEDFLGFSDVIFPAFLFIMGMSIPLAIENRLIRGDSKLQVMKHIVLRSLALLIMGVFTVNTESGVSSGIGRPYFIILMVLAFFLVWNKYPKVIGFKKNLFTFLKVIGLLMFIGLAIIYRDESGEIMQVRWWGILGLIGWTYFLCGIIYLLVRQRFNIHLTIFFVFLLLCIVGSNRWLGFFDGIIVSNGAFHVFSMVGLLVYSTFSKYGSRISVKKVLIILLFTAAAMLLAGWGARSFWIVSKISATPTWVLLSTGISIAVYLLLYYVVEIQGKEQWFKIIRPAGYATLTCYLLPYILYSIDNLLGVSILVGMRQYPLGLIKSFAFSFLVIGIAALLDKIKIRLKI